MNLKDLRSLYINDSRTAMLAGFINESTGEQVQVRGLSGSSVSLFISSFFKASSRSQFVILPDKESAAFVMNDLENLFGESDAEFQDKKVLFYPTAYRKSSNPGIPDNNYIQLRTEVINTISTTRRSRIIVSYPEALCEKVISREELKKQTLTLSAGEAVTLDFISDVLVDYHFERTDFVVEPGEFSLRGGILDVFSFSNDFPYRIEFTGNKVESLRTFDPSSQLSRQKLNKITLIPNIQSEEVVKSRNSLLELFDKNTPVWIYDQQFTRDRMDREFEKIDSNTANGSSRELIGGEEFFKGLYFFNMIEFGRHSTKDAALTIHFDQLPQPSFNKNFDMLLNDLREHHENGYSNLIFTDNPKQAERLHAIFEDIQFRTETDSGDLFTTMNLALHEGFIDRELKVVCYTDHQLFERYHRFRLRDRYKSNEAVSIKELYDLKSGDYVTHIDHGIGKYDGLEKIENNGRIQEAVRLIYKNNDLLYISIHSLHRITKYTGSEGRIPSVDKLGSNAWKNLKNKTKKKVKDIAKDLIKLYAKRKSSKGFSFSPDTYLQNELEASFMYEDTPDQIKSTRDVKNDLHAEYPMDRLICGDVGFGKTEIALRAAFKAVADSKQVALLVPTTILALQHFNTFTDRLKDFPCNVDYLSRFKSPAKQKETLQRLEEGRIDILIGTHRILSKDIKFKDLGLMIIDEEQKFGVSAKEKLKNLKVNVDTLTLTATPIPRTLQFSLMGARDMSVINTPPPNRYPVTTELRSFGEEVIRDAINYEVDRNGQVFFIHNRVQNIGDVAEMIRKFNPGVSVITAHGQMEGKQLERIMIDFIRGAYDVLVATTIVESGLDIPNVNTIIINDAQNFGLSDLHQLRGRVGRSNRKAFCYLLSPPLSVLTDEARKRLKAVEEFSELGSGFNIAMRDLDIRGAGNILGGEQSGFISDIGFEMYQKILDEAIRELKQDEFGEYFSNEPQQPFVYDCVIETDLQLMIPDSYVSNITERLSLYKELDNIESEEVLEKFGENVADRFGPIPPETEELIISMKLRWIARSLGFEKITLSKDHLNAYFVSNPASAYFQSEVFTNILRFVQKNQSLCKMKETKNKLRLSVRNIHAVKDAIKLLETMQRFAE